MSAHFETPAEQTAFFAAWHAQQQLTAGSDVLQPLPQIHLLGEMACCSDAEPASIPRPSEEPNP